MAGIEGRTGKPIGEPEHIRQSIEVILTTPRGTRVMRRDFGFPCINEQGKPKPGVTKNEAEAAVLAALHEYEPRIRDVAVVADITDALNGVTVTYTENKTGDTGQVKVSYLP